MISPRKLPSLRQPSRKHLARVKSSKGPATPEVEQASAPSAPSRAEEHAAQKMQAAARGFSARKLSRSMSMPVIHTVVAIEHGVEETAKTSAKLLAHTAKDKVLEAGSIVLREKEVPQEKIDMPTPDSRWWEAEQGWQRATTAGARKPPRDLMLAKGQGSARRPIGWLRIEVLEASGLKAQRFVDKLGISDPYVLVMLENIAVRTTTVLNHSSPKWDATTTLRAFSLPVFCPYAKAYCAVLDENAVKDTPMGRVVLELGPLRSGTVYDTWLNLRFGSLRQGEEEGKHGRLRLRYALVLSSPRARVLAYAKVRRILDSNRPRTQRPLRNLPPKRPRGVHAPSWITAAVVLRRSVQGQAGAARVCVCTPGAVRRAGLHP